MIRLQADARHSTVNPSEHDGRFLQREEDFFRDLTDTGLALPAELHDALE
jgi:hypothetical protein